jgi:hypothetical protein
VPFVPVVLDKGTLVSGAVEIWPCSATTSDGITGSLLVSEGEIESSLEDASACSGWSSVTGGGPVIVVAISGCADVISAEILSPFGISPAFQVCR